VSNSARKGLIKIPILRQSGGFLRPVSGATVLVYQVDDPITPMVTEAGQVTGGASLASIWSDAGGISTISGSQLISDSEGEIEFYAEKGSYSLHITAPNGTIMGVPLVDFAGGGYSDGFDSLGVNAWGFRFDVPNAADSASMRAYSFQIASNEFFRMFGDHHAEFIDSSTNMMLKIPVTGPIEAHVGMSFNLGNRILLIPVHSGKPGTPTTGQLVFDSTAVTLAVWTGAAWKSTAVLT